jgi:hypothetical protein
MATLPQRILGFLGFRKSIDERLVEACASIPVISKLGDNDEYKYLRIVDIVRELRAELAKRGLIIIPNDIECFRSSYSTTDPHRWLSDVRVKTEFIVTDGIERECYSAYGTGQSVDGMALAIAQTMALKSWLKRLGLIFGELDDPEIEEAAAASTPRTAARAIYPKEAGRLAEYQARAFSEALIASGRTREQVEEQLSKAFGFPVTAANITALLPEQFDVAIQLLNTNANLIEALELSTKLAKRKKANGCSASNSTEFRSAAPQ